MSATSRPAYIFPIIAPILLAIGDLFIKALAQNIAITSLPDFIIQISIILLFSFFTIDIWGLTSTITTRDEENKGEIQTIWMILLIAHFASYGVGSYVHNQFFELLKITDKPSTLSVWVNLLLVMVGFAGLFYGRNQLWNKMNI